MQISPEDKIAILDWLQRHGIDVSNLSTSSSKDEFRDYLINLGIYTSSNQSNAMKSLIKECRGELKRLLRKKLSPQ